MSARRAALWAALVAVLVSACGGGGAPAPTLPPPSAAALDFDILAVEGPWLVRVELALSPPNVPATLTYSGTASFWVRLDGSLSGEGQLTPNITGSPCIARVVSDAVLGFQVSGRAYAQGAEIRAELALQPNNPAQEEGYVLQCGAEATPQYVFQPMLWPALEALAPQAFGAFTLGGWRWDVPLRSGEQVSFEATLGKGRGHLKGTLRITRG